MYFLKFIICGIIYVLSFWVITNCDGLNGYYFSWKLIIDVVLKLLPGSQRAEN